MVVVWYLGGGIAVYKNRVDIHSFQDIRHHTPNTKKWVTCNDNIIMANTSRKRPPPEPTTNGSNTSEPSTSTIPLPIGIDQLLAKYVRHIPPGGSIQIQLVKGPTSSSVDPIAARRAAAKAARRASDNNNEGGGDNDNATEVAGAGKGIHVPLNFPRIAKFIETVTSPNFNEGGKLKDGRMYEEEVPKAKVCCSYCVYKCCKSL